MNRVRLWIRGRLVGSRIKKGMERRAMIRIAGLREKLNELHVATYGSVAPNASREEIELQGRIYDQQGGDMQNELLWLCQRHLRWALESADIDIPAELIENPEDLQYPVISAHGMGRLGRQLRKQKLNEIKEWVAVLSPVWSAIIAILGLLVALKKK